MPQSLPRLLTALAALLLAGCTTNEMTRASTTPTAVSVVPMAPVPVIELPPASITGSEETSTMLDNFTVFVAAVDGIPVAAGRSGWKAALPLKAGPRRLTLEFNRGVFAARAEVAFTAVSEATYQVKFATDAQLFGKNSYCEFWIADAATGQAMTDKVRVPLVKIEPAAK